MIPSVYQCKGYKDFVNEWISSFPSGGRGQRKKLALAIGCQTPYITHVLSGDYHFSAEQAEGCSRWMGLSAEDSEFFVLLVLKERAGTKGLQKLLERRISAKRKEESNLKKKVKFTDQLSGENLAIYYGSWHYAVIHLALMNPRLQSLGSLQTALGISQVRLAQVLDFLKFCGFISFDKGAIKILKPLHHLSKDSPLLKQHHLNWRVKAIAAIQENADENLHYSGAISLSLGDYEWVREKLSLLLRDISERVKDSKDETVAALSFDLFRLDQNSSE